MIVPLFVGREKSVAALEEAMAADKDIFLVAQLDPAEDDPDREALYDIGVVASVAAAAEAARRHGARAGRGQAARARWMTLTDEGDHLTAQVDAARG